MNTIAIFALMEAGNLTFNMASDVISKLEAKGLTIYKKKVHTHKRRPDTSEPMTPEKANAIRVYYNAYPDATQQDIANLFKVNIGRVNEALLAYANTLEPKP